MNGKILYILLWVANVNAFCTALHQGIVRRQTSVLYKFRQPLAAAKSQWSSAISTNPDFKAAVAEALALASSSHHDPSKVKLVLTYVSSIYESTASFDTLDEDIRKVVSADAAIIGCTTGGVIGQLSFAEGSLPVECEARASVGITLASFQDDISLDTFSLDKEGAKQYLENSDMILSTDGREKKNSLSLIFGTESVKSMLPAISSALSTRENCNSFGVLASGVSASYTPKIFLSKSAKDGPMQRLFLGLVGIKLTGPIFIKTVAARSCLPVGPRYRVLRRNGNEILLLKSDDPTDTVSTPLEKLDSVLHMISTDNADLLKRDLLLGIVPAREQDMLNSEYFFGQKPTAFDPLTGSITVHSLPDKDIDIVFQFCVKDSSNALLDAQRAQLKIRGLVESAKEQQSSPFALFMIGCNDRGNKIFRYRSWEAIQLHHQMSEAGYRTALSPHGFYGNGAFSRLTSSKEGGEQIPALMETDSLYILLADSPVVVEDKEVDNSILKLYESPSLDVMSEWEKRYFDDEHDEIVTSKKDSDSSSGGKLSSN
jgi:small ligand-binding sensory domain FIST